VSGPSISELTSAVMDTGRRGEPKPGCDCVQCFGYCLVDRDQAARMGSELGLSGRTARAIAINAALDAVLGEP
jgi:hypothetical protein